MKYGDNIREIREGMGITQRELARRAKVSTGYISQLESNQKGGISVDIALRIANTLSVTLDELLKESDCRHLQIRWVNEVGGTVQCKHCDQQWWTGVPAS